MKPTIRALAFCLVIAALAAAAYFIFVKAPLDAAVGYHQIAEKIIDNVASRLHYKPSVTINQTTEFFRNKAVAEIAMVEGSIIQESVWKHEWLGSMKEITLRGTYRVKTGFILDSRFSVDLHPSTKTVTVRLPPPTVLSVEQTSLDLRESEGWWNKLTPDDRQTALKDLQLSARSQAEHDSASLHDASSLLVKRLTGFLDEQGWTPQFVFEPSPRDINNLNPGRL